MPVPTDNPHLNFLQAITIGVMQGVTELFPVSSLGHSVLIPALIGGSWQSLVTQQDQAESPYLAFIVGLHVATALALLLFFWRDWVRIIGGFFSSIRHRRLETVHERMAWLIIIATIPAGIIGLALEHTFRTLFAKPEAAAIFLTLNGGILFTGEYLRRRAVARTAAAVAAGASRCGPAPDGQSRRSRIRSTIRRATSRSPAVQFSRCGRGRGVPERRTARRHQPLGHHDGRRPDARPEPRAGRSVRLPARHAGDLRGRRPQGPRPVGHLGDGIRGQVLAGGAAAFIAAIVTIKFLVRWFHTRTLTPFAWYCGIFGAFCIVRFA